MTTMILLRLDTFWFIRALVDGSNAPDRGKWHQRRRGGPDKVTPKWTPIRAHTSTEGDASLHQLMRLEVSTCQHVKKSRHCSHLVPTKAKHKKRACDWWLEQMGDWWICWIRPPLCVDWHLAWLICRFCCTCGKWDNLALYHLFRGSMKMIRFELEKLLQLISHLHPFDLRYRPFPTSWYSGNIRVMHAALIGITTECLHLAELWMQSVDAQCGSGGKEDRKSL